MIKVMNTQVVVRRTPLQQLRSEALHRVRETLALFPDAVLLDSGGARGELLKELLRDDGWNLPAVESEAGWKVVLSAAHEPGDCSGSPFGWRARADRGAPLMIYPLANWNQEALEAHGGAENGFRKNRELLKLCVVGDSDSGKSDLIAGLVGEPIKQPDLEHPRPRYLWTEDRLMIFRETRGKHASDLAVMATAWESDWAILTVDAARGLNDVTRRLLFLLALSGVPQLLVAVTGLDQVTGPKQAYEGILAGINHLLTRTSQLNLTGVIPTDAETHDWYEGESLALHLNRLVLPAGPALESLRLPVQALHGETVLGRLNGGNLKPGDEFVMLPSGETNHGDRILLGGVEQEQVWAGDSVRLSLADEHGLEAGSLLVQEDSYPVRSSELDATLLWVDEKAPVDPRSYRLYHGARLVDARISQVTSCLLPGSYEWSEGDSLDQGKVGHVSLTTAAPIYFDSFFQNRVAGRFLLLHREELKVMGVGILRGRLRKREDVTSSQERLASAHVVVDPTEVSLDQRRKKYGHKGAVLWFTGLSGSGKSAAAKETEKKLFERGCHTLFLDGDNVRTGFNGDLGFTQEERSESNRRVAELAALVHEQGQIVICSFISGHREDREFARSLVGEDFYLCFVDCPVEVCRERDPKGLYEKADAGELLSFTGVSMPYERPEDAELVLDSDRHDPETLSREVLRMLEQRGVIAGKDEEPST